MGYGADDFIVKFGKENFLKRINESNMYCFCDPLSLLENKDITIEKLDELLRSSSLCSDQAILDTFFVKIKVATKIRISTIRENFTKAKSQWRSQFPAKKIVVPDNEIHFNPNEENSTDLINKIKEKIEVDESFYLESAGKNLFYVKDKGEYHELLVTASSLGKILENIYPLKIVNCKKVQGEVVISYFARTYEDKILNAVLSNITTGYTKLEKLAFFSETPTVYESKVIIEEGYSEESEVYIKKNSISPRRETKYLDRLLSEFPFKNEASRTNTVAILLTSSFFLREFMGNHPAAVITGDSPNLGKSKISKLIYGCSSESTPTTMSFTDNDEELEKRILSKVLKDNTIVIDNIRPRTGTIVSSAFLERTLTDEKISGRLLGKNKDIERENSIQFVMTLNEGKFSEDLISRSVPIELSASMKSIDDHTFDPVVEFRKYRNEILGELLGLVIRYYESGSSELAATKHEKFPQWSKEIGRILEYGGYKDFLGNMLSFSAERDELVKNLLDFGCSKMLQAGVTSPAKVSLKASDFKVGGNISESPVVIGIRLSKMAGKTIDHLYGDVPYSIEINQVNSSRGGSNKAYEFKIINSVSNVRSISGF